MFEPAAQGVADWYDLGEVDDGPGADHGDLLLERKPLIDPDTDDPAGTAVTRVQVVDANGGNPTFIIDCTISLADGDLVFYGAGAFNDLGNGVTFAVTGGTGAYDRAAGTVTVTVVEGGAALDFELTRR